MSLIVLSTSRQYNYLICLFYFQVENESNLNLKVSNPIQSMDSSRISLRPFKLTDVDDFLKWASDDRVTRYLRWNTITSKEEALAYIDKVVIPHPWRWTICLDNRSIGYSVKPESGDNRCRAHLSYAVGADNWGQGIVTMALKVAILWCLVSSLVW